MKGVKARGGVGSAPTPPSLKGGDRVAKVYNDIRLKPDEEKEKVYEQIETLFL